jgi:hypothetical protein
MSIDLDKSALKEINEVNRDQLFSVGGVSKTIMGIEQSGTTEPAGRLDVRPTEAVIGQVIRGAVSQSANLLEFQNSAATVLTSINAAGKITTATDMEVTGSANGVILESPDATRWRVTVANDGSLTTTAI